MKVYQIFLWRSGSRTYSQVDRLFSSRENALIWLKDYDDQAEYGIVEIVVDQGLKGLGIPK